MAKNYHDDKNGIVGESIIIEIGESKFVRSKYYRIHKFEGVWTLDLVERSPERKILLFPIGKRNKTALKPLLKKQVLTNTTIYSDC
ncbi:hypothetical protein H312_02274 [Anncaliia algerae PRA339]|uniref:ISXO2-like transposase domain-containing protein n=1 Tax=Anncaliia algerae PRA339 TaxID=1288291 RepID=A0A059EZZ4_9MICR|nr:hypothetical protein H312_02274 [Anncaliia algerae PRA339]